MRTIYCKPYSYVGPFLNGIIDSKKYKLAELKPDSKPTKKDFVIFVDVASYRTFSGFWQVWKLRRQGIPMLLILEEPPAILPYNHLRIFHLPFKRIYTWKTPFLGKRYIYQPSPRRLWRLHSWKERDTPYRKYSYKQKKLLTIMFSNKRPVIPFYPGSLHDERVKAIRYFDKKLPKDFDVYGPGWDKPVTKWEKYFGFTPLKTWKGIAKEKIPTISKYRFFICYENMIKRGYMSDKIWDVFEARCVPIYLGDPDILHHVPANAFIDKRKYTYDQLLAKIKNMSEKEYDQYMKNIDKLLKSKKAQSLTMKAFCKQIVHDIENQSWNK